MVKSGKPNGMRSKPAGANSLMNGLIAVTLGGVVWHCVKQTRWLNIASWNIFACVRRRRRRFWRFTCAQIISPTLRASYWALYVGVFMQPLVWGDGDVRQKSSAGGIYGQSYGRLGNGALLSLNRIFNPSHEFLDQTKTGYTICDA